MSTMAVDDALYSRQRYVLGDRSMRQLSTSSVLIIGLNSVTLEVAKNVVLAGPRNVTIQDWQSASYADLSAAFFLTEEDVVQKRNRAEACVVKLRKLNPNVKVDAISIAKLDFYFMKRFQCIVVAAIGTKLVHDLDNFCHHHRPSIKFVYVDVRGVFGRIFCDFGASFKVQEFRDDEQSKEVFIERITKAKQGVVTTFDQVRHGFHDGDRVSFAEVTRGMSEINGKSFTIKVINAHTFQIGDTSQFSVHTGGGVARLVVDEEGEIHHVKLVESQNKPNLIVTDFQKSMTPFSAHVGFLALNRFQENYQRLPTPWSACDADMLLDTACELLKELSPSVRASSKLDEQVVRLLAYTAQGLFAPLCSIIGGIAAQEVLKAVTCRFRSIDQWFYADAMEVTSQRLAGAPPSDTSFAAPMCSRYDALGICIGETLFERLRASKIFLVGCGAIGCEVLKVLALLGVSTAGGEIVVTDHDLIEKSNLNRQFLFLPEHIQKSKSEVAKESIKLINPGVNLKAMQQKVCNDSSSEATFSDSFFERLDAVVGALDSVDSRLYIDSRCVRAEKPFIDSGTVGLKGHVQVVLPYLTESYASQRDPVENVEFPLCTLKSFPAKFEHAVQWARNKFQSLLCDKPDAYNRFWQLCKPTELLEKLSNFEEADEEMSSLDVIARVLRDEPKNWNDCVALARHKFDRYFDFKARDLLLALPLDAKVSDGSPFWQLPKRPPKPIAFDPTNRVHLSFVVSLAKLFASVYSINFTQKDLDARCIQELLSTIPTPQYIPKNKKISLGDDSEDVDELAHTKSAVDGRANLSALLSKSLQEHRTLTLKVRPAMFEKDDDDHVDFIAAAANLRSLMYGIPAEERHVAKFIAGRIVPAIATTTAVIAGFACIELVKLLQGCQVGSMRNCFLHLAADPFVVFCEPAPPQIQRVKNSELAFTLWDRWRIEGNSDFTLDDMAKEVQNRSGCSMSLLAHGTKAIYMKGLPGHEERRQKSAQEKAYKILSELEELFDLCPPPRDSRTDWIEFSVGLEPPSANDADETGSFSGPTIYYRFGVHSASS